MSNPHANHQGEPGDTGTGRSGRVTLLPSALWQALDAEAEIWARETDVASWLAQLSSDPRSREKLDAVTRLCFEEGFYRGAMAAIEKRSLADSINEAASAPTPPDRVGEEVGGADFPGERFEGDLTLREAALEVVNWFDKDGAAGTLPEYIMDLRAALKAAPSPEAGAGGDLGGLERLSKAATPGPWAYRPEHLDDWGYIRSMITDSLGLKGKVVATTRGDEHGTHDAHRAAGTDPYEANGRYIVALVNAHRSGKLVHFTGSGEEKGATLQARNAAWMRVAFADDPTDLPERIARFGEEALELQQALGQSREDAHALLDYVFSRPAGAPATEFGQTAGSLACLAEFAGHDLEAAAEAELDRVSTPEFLAKLRAKRATRHGRGPLPGFSAPGTSEPEATPKASPGQTPVDPQMTVEEASQVLREASQWTETPEEQVAQGRNRASVWEVRGDLEIARLLRGRADKVEAALRTLQAAGEVR